MATTIETLTAAADGAEATFRAAQRRFDDYSRTFSKATGWTRAENDRLYDEMVAAKSARKVAEDALFAAGGE